MAALIRLLVGGLAATAARVRPDLRRRPVERRDRRRLPDPRAARGGGVRERRAAPAGRAWRPASRASARSSASTRSPAPIDAQITEITNEALGAAGGAPLTILANYWFSIVSSIVLAIVAARHHRARRRAAARGLPAGTAGEPQGIAIEDDADAVTTRARRAARPALRAHRLPRASSALVLLYAPPRRAAPRPGDRRHHRQHAVHGQPAVHHRDVVPDLGRRLRLRGRDVHEGATTSSRR